MVRKFAAMLALVLFLPVVPALAADSPGKVSGLLKDIRPDGKLVIEEQGPWKGPGTGLISRTVELSPGTAIRVVRPTGRWDAKDPMPGYDVEIADFRVLKPGDFVTVTTAGGSAAVAVDVMRGDAAEAGLGLASPRTETFGTK